MSSNKDQSQNHSNLIKNSGLSGKSITSLDAFVHGTTYVLLVGYSGGSTYLKWKQGSFEYGGTQDWGTGTRVF